MKKFITIFVGAILLLFTQSAYAQVHKSGTASVKNNNGSNAGTQYVSINLNKTGSSTVTIGNLTMKAKVFTTQQDTQYGIIAYGVTLTAPNGKSVDCVINTYTGDNHITMVVHYGDGKKVYEL